MTFNKLKALTTDPVIVAEAIKTSQTLIELSDSGDRVRRKTRDLPKQDDGVDVSVYSEGWPASFRLDDIQEAIAAAGNKPLFIKMRRDKERNEFLGSCFIEFDSPGEVEECLKNADKIAGKSLEAGQVKLESMASWLQKTKRDDKNKRSSDAAAAASAQAAKKMGLGVPGTVLCLDGLVNACAREDIRAFFGDETVAYVDHNREQKDAKVRFHTAEGATKALEKVRVFFSSCMLSCTPKTDVYARHLLNKCIDV